MLLTQRTDIQKNCDAKFQKFREISLQSVKTKDNLNKEYESQCKQAEDEFKKCKEAKGDQMRHFKKAMKDKLKKESDHPLTNKFPEFANIMTAIA